MRIVINIQREKRGDRHSTPVVRTRYETDLRDDVRITNAGRELYNYWLDALRGATNFSVVEEVAK